MHMNKSSPILAVATLLMGLAPAAAAPGDQIGSAIVVVNQVTAELSRDVRTLRQGDRVRHSELIEAGSDARTELSLDDKTKLALGPGARLVLDKFVYDPDKSGGSILVDLMKGTFRFITGVAAKPAYVIRTPAAAITVRGTIFDVLVRDSGETWLLLSEGGVQVCNARGKCRVVDRPGEIIRISDEGEVGSPACWSRLGDGPGLSFEQAFPFVVSPPSVDPKPVFTEAVLTGDEACAAKPKQKQKRAEAPPKKPAKKAAKQETRQKPVKKVVKVEKPRRTISRVRVVDVSRIPVVIRDRIRIKWPRKPSEPVNTLPGYGGHLRSGSINLGGGLRNRLSGGKYPSLN